MNQHFWKMIAFYLFLFLAGAYGDSQFLFRNKLTDKRYFDPTVDEQHYKSLPQIHHRAKSNFLIYPGAAPELHKPHPIVNSIFNPTVHYFETYGSYHPDPSHQTDKSNPQNSITKYTFEETPHLPSHHSSGRSYTFKFKTPEKDIKKGLIVDYDSKLSKSGYIPLSVSCKYNTTTCKSAHNGLSEKYNSRESLKLHSSYNQKYDNKFSRALNIIIPKDFVPLFDDDTSVLNKNQEDNEHVLPYLGNNIEAPTKNTELNYKVQNSSNFRKNLYKIPEDTLFRHSFDFKAPSKVPKYITI